MPSVPSMAGLWHLVPANTPDGDLPAHRMDVIFRDGADGLAGAVRLRHGRGELPLSSLTFDGAVLRLQLSPPEGFDDDGSARPWLTMVAVGDRFEGAWDTPGAEDIRLKLVRAADEPAPGREPRSVEPPIAGIDASVAPLLSVRGGALAVEFYKAAFGAVEVYRVEDPGGDVVSRLSVGGGEFWVSDESPAHGNFSPASLGGGTVRMILTVADPDALFARAMAAGATEITPMENNYGWRVGRIADPFGHHWEIGRPLSEGTPGHA